MTGCCCKPVELVCQRYPWDQQRGPSYLHLIAGKAEGDGDRVLALTHVINRPGDARSDIGRDICFLVVEAERSRCNRVLDQMVLPKRKHLRLPGWDELVAIQLEDRAVNVVL